MAGKLVNGRVDPIFEKLADLRRRVLQATGEEPQFQRGMGLEEFSRLAETSIKTGKLAPELRHPRVTREMIVD